MSARKIFLLLLAICFTQNLYAQEITDSYFTQTIEQFADQKLIRPEHRKEFVSLAQNIDQEAWTQIDRKDMGQKLENPEWTDDERLIWKGIYVYYYYLMTLTYKGLEIYQTEDLSNTNAKIEAQSFFRALCFIAYFNANNLMLYMKGESIFAPRAEKMLPEFVDKVNSLGPEITFNYYFPAQDLYSMLARAGALRTLSANKFFYLAGLSEVEEKFPDSFFINLHRHTYETNYQSAKASYDAAFALRSHTFYLIHDMIKYGYNNRLLLEKLIPQIPFVLNLYKKLALNYLNQNRDIKKAESILDEALNHIELGTHPHDIQIIYAMKSYIYSFYLDEDHKDYDKAEKYIDKIRQLAPDYIDTYRMVQKLWLNIANDNQRRNNKALADMKKLLELCQQYDVPVQAEDYRYTAKFYMNMQEYEKAYPLLVKAIDAEGLGMTLPKVKLKRDFGNILENYWPPGGPSKKVEAFLRSVN